MSQNSPAPMMRSPSDKQLCTIQPRPICVIDNPTSQSESLNNWLARVDQIVKYQASNSRNSKIWIGGRNPSIPGILSSLKP